MTGVKAAATALSILVVCGACDSASQQAHIPDVDTGVTPDSGVAAAVVPARRGGAPAAWMPTAGEMVIFGGMDPITNDTFSFDREESVWRQLAPERQGAVPSNRCHHTLTQVPDSDEALLFGGFSRGTRFNDTWRFDSAAETWTEVATTGTVPAKRCLHASAFITSRRELLMFGGIAGGGNLAGDFFDDTHVLDVEMGTWLKVEGPGPSAREGSVMIYSAAVDAVFLWGGKAFDHYPTELWQFDVDARTWSQAATGGVQPKGREDPTFFWDESRDRLTIFSGRNDNDPTVLFDDGYELDLISKVWSRIDAGTLPSSRWRASAAVDSAGDRGYMFGGWRDFGGADAFNDTWRYDLEARTWAQVPGN
jgi:N-acetylneuraminic acid mutarotase